MSKANPLGLVNYGDSDDDSEDGNKRVETFSKMKQPTYESSQSLIVSDGIQPAPIPHCPWSACYDENSGFTYYWNQHTNAVTWEAPPEYLLALKLAQQHLHTGSSEVSAEEWQLYQQALAEKQSSQSKVITKAPVVKPLPKKQDKSGVKDKQKNSKKRPVSDEEEEKIELITSYHNSDSDSNDEPEKPPQPTVALVPKPATKLPLHPQKKQKTKPVAEYGPPLPPNQDYTVPIGPELPPELIVEEKPKSPQEKLPKEEKTNAITEERAEEEIKVAPVSNDEDIQEEKELLKRLKDKAKLLEKLGGELPSELQQIIKDDSLSRSGSPKTEIKDPNVDIDDLLEEIEKKELPKVVKSKIKDERCLSNTNSCNNSPRSGDQTPPLEELKALYPGAVNGPVATLFPSAVNIDASKPDSRPETPPIVIVEKEKKENVYLMDSKEPKENISKKKLRISNSVLPERKKIEKVEPPSYTTKYSQFIEGFSNERTGLGFTKEEDVEKTPKNTISYGNGLTFTKGETLNEEKKDDDLDDLTELLEAKLKFLNQIQQYPLSPVQEMFIQMQTLVSAFRGGALSAAYWRRWASGAARALQLHEAAAAPPGWLCVFQRPEARYCYRRESDGFVQYEYPAVANTDMEICTTPPHPGTDPKEEINPPLPPMPPPPPSPPGWWSRATPPPPGTDPPDHPEPPELMTVPESKKEIGDELLSFYNDIAELEKTSEPTAPNSPEVPPPPPPPDITDGLKEKSKEKPKEKPKEKDCKDKITKKKPKVKLSSSLGMKQKTVSTLVAKWQQVADEIGSD